MSLFLETSKFAELANLPWHFDTFNSTEFAVLDSRGRLVHSEVFENFQRHGEEYAVAFEAWQQNRVRWQFIVHASQLLPKMFGHLIS